MFDTRRSSDGPTGAVHLLRRIDPDNPSDVRAIARMHLELLSWGPLAALGRPFRERCCYSMLLREDLMRAFVYQVQGEPAGFVAYTCQPAGFLLQVVRRHVVRIVWLALVSVLCQPRGILRLVSSMRRLRYKIVRGTGLPSADAEILAIGVYPHYRSACFVNRTGLHIGRELFQTVVRELRARKKMSVQMDVDGFNREVLLFYHALGGSFHRFAIDGELHYRIIFELPQLEG